MTLWPGTQVPVPRLRVSQARLLPPGIIIFGSESEEHDVAGLAREKRVVELPAELYVREFMEVDASDAAATEAFCRRYGPVGEWALADLPAAQAAGARWPTGRCFLPEPWRSLELGVARGAAAFDADIAGTIGDALGEALALAELVGFKTVAQNHPLSQVGLYQDVMHDMICIWRLFSEGSSHEELTSELRVFATTEGDATDAGRAAQLAEALNRALSPFTVRLEGRMAADEGLSTDDVNVYQAMCLQLANHIAENATYRRCANEPCGRRFVRQRGGAKFGQHHTSSVLYCTPQCARAQASRALRRRKREAKEAKETQANTRRGDQS